MRYENFCGNVIMPVPIMAQLSMYMYVITTCIIGYNMVHSNKGYLIS